LLTSHAEQTETDKKSKIMTHFLFMTEGMVKFVGCAGWAIYVFCLSFINQLREGNCSPETQQTGRIR
jgi:hypothetical protein